MYGVASFIRVLARETLKSTMLKKRFRLVSALHVLFIGVIYVITPAYATSAIGDSNQAKDQLAVDFSGSYRVRYEALNNPIFPTSAESREQSNQRISTRIIFKTTLNYNNVSATLDIRDSRAFLDENDPTLGSNQVNTLEPVQLFVSYKPESIEGINAIKFGRMELDYGSRRLLAKAIYRNATNSYDGLVVEGEFNDWLVNGVYLLPVSRFPNDRDSIDANSRGIDKSFSERKFFGFYAQSPSKNTRIQSYWLKEKDSADLATRNRDLYTLSLDYTKPLGQGWKVNAEIIGQIGSAHESASPNDVDEKDVRAYMLFGYVGKQITDNTFLRAEVDYISGDNDNTDNTISDFDSLYGVRRFDFGPTDVYQGFQRRNLKTFGLRSVSKPTRQHNIMLGYKAYWYQKAPEAVDSFIGHQVEARWRYWLYPELRLSLGGAYLFKGEGFERGDYSDNSAFLFTGAMYSF